MGRLAKWGAVAGAAKGVQENIAHERKIEMSDLDEQREARLRTLENEMKGKREERGYEVQSELLGQRGEQAQTLQGGAQEFKGAEAEKTREFEGEEGQLDRESAERIAGIKAGTSGTTGAFKRWEAKTSTQTRTGKDGIPEQYDSVALFDKGTGRTYMQQGSRFVPQGTDPKAVRRAPRDAIQELLENPASADAFIEAYSYLPIEFFSALQAQPAQPPTP